MLHASPRRMNQVATLAAVPLLVLGAILASRADVRPAAEPAPPPAGEGLLVVANLQSWDLTIHALARAQNPPRTLKLPGPPHEIAVLGNRIYVTLGRADLVVEVDPFVPAILRTVSLPGHPHGIAIDAGGIHVTLDEADQLVTLDWSTLKEIRRTRTGATPHAVATLHGTRYVTDSRDGRLRRIDDTGARTVSAGVLPESIVAAGQRLFVADAAGDAVRVFDAATLESIAVVPVTGHPVRVAISGDRLLVARNHAASLAVLDLATLTVEAAVDVSAFPDGICSSPSGRLIAVPSNTRGSVTLVDSSNWTALGSLQAGGAPGACAWLPGN